MLPFTKYWYCMLHINRKEIHGTICQLKSTDNKYRQHHISNIKIPLYASDTETWHRHAANIYKKM
jgi:hypothetical protein